MASELATPPAPKVTAFPIFPDDLRSRLGEMKFTVSNGEEGRAANPQSKLRKSRKISYLLGGDRNRGQRCLVAVCTAEAIVVEGSEGVCDFLRVLLSTAAIVCHDSPDKHNIQARS